MEKKYAFGIDIGGTTVKIGLFDLAGAFVEKWEIPTNTAQNGREILPDIARAVRDKLAQLSVSPGEVEGIGLGVPGPVDRCGNVLHCVNLGWGEFNVEETLGALTGLKVRAGNDANVAALGEMWKGGGAGHDSIVMVTLGTGVGGGVIIGGKILAGANGAGGEIGHMPAAEDEPEPCGCGNHGCLEQYASATGIVRMAKRKLSGTDRASVLRGKDPMTAKDVLDAAKAGDKIGLELLEELGDCLGTALARVAAVCNPQVFVIGGGVSRAGKILTDAVEKYFRKKAFHAVRNTPIVTAKLGNDAGMIGGVKLVLPDE